MHRYVLALGSNRRHGRHGSPPAVLRAAVETLANDGVVPLACSPVVVTAPVGPSRRRYANAVLLCATSCDPPAMLALAKTIERRFGRRRGRRWGARVLDIDLIWWSGGTIRVRDLILPHPAATTRAFVLGPLATIMPDLRLTGGALTVRHHRARLTRRRHPRTRCA